MRIAILGAGSVGKSLGTALGAKGHDVAYGVRGPSASGAATAADAIACADVVILATPWTFAEALVCEHATALAGRIVIDTTNPLNASASRLALGFDTSGAEILQSHMKGATVFKAFNMVGTSAISRPRYPQGRAAVFVAGPQGPQKETVFAIASDLGFEAVDAGDLRAARLLEPLGALRLYLEGAGENGRDVAFVLGSRALKQVEAIRSHTSTEMETQGSDGRQSGRHLAATPEHRPRNGMTRPRRCAGHRVDLAR